MGNELSILLPISSNKVDEGDVLLWGQPFMGSSRCEAFNTLCGHDDVVYCRVLHVTNSRQLKSMLVAGKEVCHPEAELYLRVAPTGCSSAVEVRILYTFSLVRNWPRVSYWQECGIILESMSVKIASKVSAKDRITKLVSEFKGQKGLMGNSSAKAIGQGAANVITKPVSPSAMGGTETAIFAAGCFWGVELAFQRVPGVLKTTVGYIDGHSVNPTYEQVCSGTSGHTEAVKIDFSPAAVSYDELLTVLWDRMDPTTLNRQGNDAGTQYRSGQVDLLLIYYTTPEQRDVAINSKEAQQQHYTSPIVTEIKAATTFYPAENYHQQYLEKGGQCALKGDTTAIRCYG
ncbi:unnamed protein product [Discosporangium mesarthrocarpum]